MTDEITLENLSFPKFLEVCRKANEIIELAKKRDITLTGHSPSTLKAAAIHHLAKINSLPIGLHELTIIYPISHPSISSNRKKLAKALRYVSNEVEVYQPYRNKRRIPKNQETILCPKCGETLLKDASHLKSIINDKAEIETYYRCKHCDNIFPT